MSIDNTAEKEDFALLMGNVVLLVRELDYKG